MFGFSWRVPTVSAAQGKQQIQTGKFRRRFVVIGDRPVRRFRRQSALDICAIEAAALPLLGPRHAYEEEEEQKQTVKWILHFSGRPEKLVTRLKTEFGEKTELKHRNTRPKERR